MSNLIVRIAREELYQQVWETQMRALAEKYGLSDVGLAKICERFQIPRPSVGYWAKREFGKAPSQPAGVLSEQQRSWLAWAEGVADRLDPLLKRGRP